MSKLEDLHWTRRTFAGVAATGALATKTPAATAAARDGDGITPVAAGKAGPFWPNGARLAISISLMFEGGGQPISGAGGGVPEPIKPGYPNQVTNTFFDYGVNEGIPRALDLFDKHGIKVTSFMISQAIEKHPELAQ